jgi:hypothetical protein
MTEPEVTDQNGVPISDPSADLNTGVTPNYNEPEDADRYPVAIPAPLAAHTVFKGNPQIDGPYLDDVIEAQVDARRRADDAVAEIQRKKVEEQQAYLESLKAQEETEPEAEEVTEEEPESETEKEPWE